MATNALCMGCMQPLGDGETKCAHCGYPVGGVNPPEYLRIRTLLSGRYLVGRVLEIGGDSAVYIGYDKQEDCAITLQEFFPATLCTRQSDGSLAPVDGNDAVLAEYRTKFLRVARTVARLRDVLVVVPPYDIFEENGTAYTVAEFCEGQSLGKYVSEKGGRLSFEETRRLFLPLLSALSIVHSVGLLHLGISPKNILVDAEGNLRLKNFAIPETRTANAACKPSLIAGYAAPEQYEADADCTPASDVYGVAASMFFALTGRHPAEAAARGKKDDLMMPAEAADKTPPHIKESLIRALRVHPQRRTQTVQQLLDEMTATSAVAALIREDDEEEAPEKKSGAKAVWIVFIMVVLVLAAGMLFLFDQLGILQLGGADPTKSTTKRPTISAEATTSTQFVSLPSGEVLREVTELRGKLYADVKKTTLADGMTVVLKGYEYNDKIPKGYIIAQSPAPGEMVKSGTTISVTISAGSSKGVMPDLIGWQEDHARLYLQALGYKLDSTRYLKVSQLGLGKGIVELTEPAAGTPIEVGDTIALYVNDVDETVE